MPKQHRPTVSARKLDGFSLLELMIATVLGAILLVTASSMFMVFMISNTATNARRQISTEGQQMLGTIQFHIRNAQSATVDGGCSAGGTSGNTLVLTKLNNEKVTFCGLTTSNYLFFNPTSGTCLTDPKYALNSDFSVSTAKDAVNGYFTCKQAANGKQTVEIKFNLSVTPGSAIVETFTTLAQLRNS